MQGSAFGLRAWYGFDLLRTFAGKGTDGNMYGVPIMTEPAATDKIDNESIHRAGVDECVKQILEDCDSAYFYLPESNRDYPGDPAQSLTVTGSVRYKTLDRVCIDAIRAMVWLFWASPSFNPGGNVDRYTRLSVKVHLLADLTLFPVSDGMTATVQRLYGRPTSRRQLIPKNAAIRSASAGSPI